MKDEVSCATKFIVGFFQKADDVPSNAVEKFKKCFADRLTKKYLHHWHPQAPHRGGGFRSITIDHDSIDPLIVGSLKDASLDSVVTDKILKKLPKELSLWVDPNEVSYRFGDFGSVGVLFKQSPPQETTSDYESGVSSVDSSPCSSPPQSPYEYRQQQQQSAHSIHRPCGREAFMARSQFPQYLYYNGMETVA
ncbi:protein BTG2-like [Babylonia areolata]|uniref:protein BTG2-like n=1 Tax=Babylonia areolata TaxID=304850 RepID=UPI003FD5CA47